MMCGNLVRRSRTSDGGSVTTKRALCCLFIFFISVFAQLVVALSKSWRHIMLLMLAKDEQESEISVPRSEVHVLAKFIFTYYRPPLSLTVTLSL